MKEPKTRGFVSWKFTKLDVHELPIDWTGSSWTSNPVPSEFMNFQSSRPAPKSLINLYMHTIGSSWTSSYAYLLRRVLKVTTISGRNFHFWEAELISISSRAKSNNSLERNKLKTHFWRFGGVVFCSRAVGSEGGAWASETHLLLQRVSHHSGTSMSATPFILD